MEIQIQDLVESIKKDGIEEAKKQSEQIIAQANAQAKEIVDNANEQAKKILSDAQKEIDLLKQSAEIGIQQAKRDTLLSLKGELDGQFSRILSNNIKKALDDKALVALISAAVADQDVSKLTAEVASVSEALKAGLAKEIKEGLEIKPVKGMVSGFRISEKDGSGYFDFTEEALCEMIKPFLGDLTV